MEYYVFENIMENGAFAHTEQMLHFSKYFQKYKMMSWSKHSIWSKMLTANLLWRKAVSESPLAKAEQAGHFDTHDELIVALFTRLSRILLLSPFSRWSVCCSVALFLRNSGSSLAVDLFSCFICSSGHMPVRAGSRTLLLRFPNITRKCKYKVRKTQRSGFDTIKYHADPGYQWESNKLTIRHHKREPRGQPFPSR